MSTKKPTPKPIKVTPIARAGKALISENTAMQRKEKADNIPNNSWDDVNKLSTLCSQLLLKALGLRPALENKRLMEQVEDVQSLQQSAHILARDLKSFADEISSLRARHAGKSGNASTQDENMEAIDIYMKYAMFAERFEANVTPIVMHMVEIIHTAESKLRDIDNDAADQIGKQVSDELQSVEELPLKPTPPAAASEEDLKIIPNVPPLH